jgi:hypothetical protein
MESLSKRGSGSGYNVKEMDDSITAQEIINTTGLQREDKLGGGVYSGIRGGRLRDWLLDYGRRVPLQTQTVKVKRTVDKIL